MSNNFIKKITAYMAKYHMIEAGDFIITGVSGGADSVCLLLVLCELQRERDITIRAVHIEHGVRGEASRKDAGFVAALCDRLGISFLQVAFDVPKIAGERGLSVEEAGRMVRYQVFEAEAAKVPRGKIAVAHNQNDNAETILHHLIRGSGLQGMTGIPPVRGNIIRPLLGVSREEIELYLSGCQQEYCTDATNFDSIYTRNRIRGEVIPILRELNPGAVLHMAQAAEVLRDTREYLEGQMDLSEKQSVIYQDDTAIIMAEPVQELPEVLLHILIHRVLGKCAGSSRDIAEIHVKMVAELFRKQVGRQVDLPYAMAADRIYEGIRVQKERPDMLRQVNIKLSENPDFSCRIIEKSSKIEEIPKKKYTKWLDYDRIEDSLCVRNRRPGDFFFMETTGHSKRLKQYFVDEKVPREMRQQILLVADGEHIVWIVGYRLSAYYKVNEHTRRILEVCYNGGKEDE